MTEERPSEKQIRNNVAKSLGKLEDGLTLVDTEVHLPNAEGAKGFIDILAKDRRGLFVVIEIKKSDNTARQAIHELIKYVALLRMNHGLGHHQMRCAVLSTDWRELLVPFSQFARAVDYPVEGWRMELDAAGNPTQFTAVTPLEEAEIRTICPIHMAYLWQSEALRDASVAALDAACSSLDVRNYFLLAMDHIDPSSIPFPFAQFLVIDALTPSERTRLVERLVAEGRSSDDLGEEEESNPWILEETIFSTVWERAAIKADEVASEGSDRFSAELGSWTPKGVKRRGRFTSSLFMGDGDLIAAMKGWGGSHPTVYSGVSTPKYEASWQSMKENAAYSLLGNPDWTDGFSWFLSKVERESPRATVSVLVYNPQDIFATLNNLRLGEPAVLPTVEVAVEGAGEGMLLYLVGTIAWDEHVAPTSPEETIGSSYGSVENYLLQMARGETYHFDNTAMAQHRLRYTLHEIEIREGNITARRKLVRDGGDYSPVEVEGNPHETLAAFCSANGRYIEALKALLGKMIFRV